MIWLSHGKYVIIQYGAMSGGGAKLGVQRWSGTDYTQGAHDQGGRERKKTKSAKVSVNNGQLILRMASRVAHANYLDQLF